MTTGVVVGTIIVAFVGILLTLFGYLIKNQSMATLIAGYDAKKVKDTSGLTKFVGGHVVTMGEVLLFYALLLLFLVDRMHWGFHVGVAVYMFVHSFWIMFKARSF